MFANAVAHVNKIAKLLPDNIFFFGETLQRPRHNVLTYNSVPLNNIALFGGVHLPENTWLDYDSLTEWATYFDVSIVTLLDNGLIEFKDSDELLEYLNKLLNTESALGGPNIEGIVVKNLHQDYFIGEVYLPFLTGKFVSEKFKEIHRSKSYGKTAQKGKYEQFVEQFKTEARWNKAVQHLNEAGTLKGDLPDIGPIINEIKRDIKEEASEDIKDGLYRIFIDDILRNCVRGVPEWYKEKLIKEDN